MTQGYRRTKVGAIPVEWSVEPLIGTLRLPVGQVDPRREPYCSMTLVAPDHIEPETGRLLLQQTAAEQGAASGKYAFKAGDIVYSKIRPYLRKAILADFDGLCSADMYPLGATRGVSARFMLEVMLGRRFSLFAEAASARSGIPKVNRRELAEFQVALPPLREQHAIADVLSDTDVLLVALEALITKMRDIKRGALQQLLTGRTRLPGFAGEWKEETLLSVVEALEAGVSVNARKDDSCMSTSRVLKTSALANGILLPSESKPIASRDICRARTSPRRNTILISRMNTPDLVGEVAYVERDYRRLFLPDRIWMTRFRAEDALNVRWLAYALRSPRCRSLLRAESTGTSGSMRSIAKPTLLGLPIRFPRRDEQDAIASVLADMDAEIAALECRRDKAKAIKRGMVQQLLTGRVRLVKPSTTSSGT